MPQQYDCAVSGADLSVLVPAKPGIGGHEVSRESGVNDIRHHIVMAEGFVAGMTYATFKDDNLHLYPVTRCLEIISEASRRLPAELKERHPTIQWKDNVRSGPIPAVAA